jgi:hypothetical protein
VNILKSMKAALLAASVMMPGAAWAQAVTLTPASPQPKAGQLAPGLAVKYAFRNRGRSLSEAKSALKSKSEPGKPIAGLIYEDEPQGSFVLTSGRTELVAAAISGYIKFEKAGSYVLDFLTNDGLEISIGGQQVGLYDGVHSCGYAGEIEVSVPKAGFYALEATYFQRKGTACLMMEWGPDSDGLELVPASAFFH